MLAYVVRRTLYAIPILVGINLITFALFFMVNTPDDMARMQLGVKRVTAEAIDKWKADRGYDKPLLWNAAATGSGRFVETVFFEKSVRLFALDFGRAEDNRDIGNEIRTRMWPSLALAVPVFLVGLAVNVSFALGMAFFRATPLDLAGVIACVAMMSISSLFYIIGGQYLISKLWHLVPISGYAGGIDAVKFLVLPVLIGVVSGIGAGSRWYRTLFLEEMSKDYVRTARAKGLSERVVMFRHVLRNALIPILTGVVVVIPLLFMGSLISESFFGIPGLGSYTIDAIQAQDFAVVRAMVFIGSVLYIAGLLLTDISYTVVDPRVRLDYSMPVLLATDVLVWLLVAAVAGFAVHSSRHSHLAAPWARVFRSRAAAASSVFLGAYVLIGMLDSLHYRPVLPARQAGDPVAYSVEVRSLLDAVLAPLRERREKTYSAPLAVRLYQKELVELTGGGSMRDYPRLRHGGAHLGDPGERDADVARRAAAGFAAAAALWVLVVLAGRRTLARRWPLVPWDAAAMALGAILALAGPVVALAGGYYVLGTDRVGTDVLYQALKSIRTSLVIGTLTTLVLLPLGVAAGIAAGYFRGWIDDLIQYAYTTLNSIPGVLLIAASVLMVQVYVDTHADLFPTSAQRADFRLLSLCVILGAIGWTGLARLLRGEALKLSELEYIQAAHAFGVSHARILMRHILPNVAHLVIISLVLDFSGLVLAEAVLSYVGVGVDPSTISFGTMINAARLEMAREPMVWWLLAAAFIFMFVLVLAANLFADAVRDGFDPRIRVGGMPLAAGKPA